MKVLKLLFTTFLLVFVVTITAKSVTYEQLPNRPYWRGFYYCLDMADYQQLLLSNMPYEVLQGYIVADSAVQVMPSITYLYNPIEELNLQSDTVSYIYKYWYYMNDYNPLRFYWFRNKKYPEAKNMVSNLYSDMRDKMYIDPRFTYVASDYILHIYVNNTVWIDTANTTSTATRSETVAYCKVLDTLKGIVFPSLDDAIFYNGDIQGVNEIKNNSYSIPQQTDIVFSYRDQWDRGGERELFDSNGDHWIKPNREYIVFLSFLGIDAIGEWDSVDSIHKEYYTLLPYPLQKGSHCMYPIENGNVIDEENELELGTLVPVDVFKQKIINKINDIKNYGE